MKIGDTLSLLKAGYKANEISEISALSNDNAEIIELAKSAQGIEDFKTLLELSREAAGEDPAPEPPAEPDESVQTPPEQSKENAELLKEIDDLKAQLAKAQKANVSKDNSDGDGDKTEERLKELMQSLY